MEEGRREKMREGRRERHVRSGREGREILVAATKRELEGTGEGGKDKGASAKERKRKELLR